MFLVVNLPLSQHTKYSYLSLGFPFFNLFSKHHSEYNHINIIDYIYNKLKTQKTCPVKTETKASSFCSLILYSYVKFFTPIYPLSYAFTYFFTKLCCASASSMLRI